MLLSLALKRNGNESESGIDLYFCVFASKPNSVLKTSKFPRRNCESNRVIIKKRREIIPLTDEKNKFKIFSKYR